MMITRSSSRHIAPAGANDVAAVRAAGARRHAVVALIVEPALTRDEWVRIGELLEQAAETSARAWWRGDWFNFGLAKFGTEALQRWLAEPAWRGPSYHTCHQTAATARAVPAHRRRPELFHTLHRAIARARLPLDMQERLLDRAAKEQPSVQVMCEWVRDARSSRVANATSATRDELLAHFEPLFARNRTVRERALRVIERDLAIATRVMRGEISLGRADQLARAAYEQRRTEFAQQRRLKAEQVAQANKSVSVLGDDPAYMAKQLARAVRILSELSLRHIAIYLLRRELDQDERRFMDERLGDSRRYLRRVEDAFAAGAGDINGDSNDDRKARA
jgi:hypothetical protein